MRLLYITIFLINNLIYANETYQVDTLFSNQKYKKVIKILIQKDKENKLSLDDYYYLTKSFGKIQQYSNGLFYATKMQRECMKLKDTTNLVKAYNLRAENLIDLNKIQLGIKYCEDIASNFRNQDSVSFQAFCFKWGMMYKINGQTQKALDIYKKITIKKYHELALFKNNYATILESLGKLDEALKFYKNGLIKDKKFNKDLSIAYSNIGSTLYKLKKIKEAKLYLDSAKNSITKETPLRNRKIVYEKLFRYYLNYENSYLASISLDSVNSISEDIFNKKLDEEVQILENSHKKEQELSAKLVKSQKVQFSLIIVTLIIFIVFMLIFYSLKYKNIETAHEKIVLEQKLLRSQMTPHFIFNSLSVLQGMILSNEINKSTRYLSKFSRLLRVVLENSREKLVPLEYEIEAIKNYIELQNMRRKFKISLNVNISNVVSSHNFLIPPMIIQPFIENSVLHGFNVESQNHEIDIDINFNHKTLMCIVKDNGIGLDSTNKEKILKKDSLSIKINKERLKILSKELKVKTSITIRDRKDYNEQGTLVTILLPYKTKKE